MSARCWVFESAPTLDDERAVSMEWRSSDGTLLAAGLWANGTLDTTSDGCGVWEGLRSDDVDWPTEEEAMAAVWGRE